MYRTKLGHVHLKVRDLDRAVDFYTRFLNMNVVERVGDHYVFLSGGPMHHEVALQSVGAQAPAPHPYGVGLYHVAFEVPDRQALAMAYRALQTGGVRVSPVDHHISWALYFSDPDGNGLELYCDTRSDEAGKPLWQGYSRELPGATLEALLADGEPSGRE